MARSSEVKTKTTTIEFKPSTGLESIRSAFSAGELNITKASAVAVRPGNDTDASKLAKFNKGLFERLFFGGLAQIGSGFLVFDIYQNCEFLRRLLCNFLGALLLVLPFIAGRVAVRVTSRVTLAAAVFFTVDEDIIACPSAIVRALIAVDGRFVCRTVLLHDHAEAILDGVDAKVQAM